MLNNLFPTFEIGSLAKPLWRTKPFLKIPLEESDIEDAKKWGKFLQIENEELLSILAKKEKFTVDDKNKIIYFSSLYATRLQEKAGLDWIFDGEQHRVEMYQYPIKFCDGFKFLGEVRSFDNKYYKKATIVAPVQLRKPYHTDEFLTIKKFAKKNIKIPITGPYTICDWSYDEFYTSNSGLSNQLSINKTIQGRKKLLEDIAFNIIRKNIESLIKNGARWIQIDEPAFASHAGEVSLVCDVIKRSLENLKCIFSVHICFSDYNNLFPHIKQWQKRIRLFALEFANRDKNSLGIKPEIRIGYEILKKFKHYEFDIGLGVLNIHTDFIEPPELIRDRILWAAKLLGDPKRIFVNPDCGLRTRSWEVSFKKLVNLVKGRDLALKSL